MLVISIDPGESISGVSVIMLSTESLKKAELIGFNVDNSLIVSEIKKYYVKYNTKFVIEDIRPYRQQVSKQILNTCKFIGELNYRLKKELNAEIQYMSRGDVKKWVFERYFALSVEKIDRKIEYLDDYGAKNGAKRYINKDGSRRKASFHWVDDRIVIAVMKEFWEIPTPKPGKNNIYGFSSHAWQALAVGTCYLYPVK